MPVSMTITIDQKAVAAALKRLDPGTVAARLAAGMNEAIHYLKGEVQKLTPVNTGMARGSIFTAMHGRTIDGLRGEVGSPLEYVTILEYGRRAGSAPPPTEAIQAWAARKIGDGSRQTAYLIARAIGRRGLPAHRMFQLAAQRGVSTVERIVTRHLGGL